MLRDDTVERTIALVAKRSANHRYFFEQLTDPRWIEPLAARGFFSNPPEGEKDGDYVSFPVWVESQYLVRMAVHEWAHATITRILKGVPRSDNPRVYEDIADAATLLPASYAVQLIHKVREGLRLPFQMLLPEKAGEVLGKLAEGNRRSEVLALGKDLFAVRPDPSTKGTGERTAAMLRQAIPRVRCDAWEYGEILRKHVKAFVRATGLEGLRVLIGALSDALRFSNVGTGGDDTSRDYSTVWRHTIEHDQNRGGRDVRDLLVSAVRDGALELCVLRLDLAREVARELGRRQQSVFQRLMFFVLTRTPEPDLPLVTTVLQSREKFDNGSFDPEFARLQEAHFMSLPPVVRQTIFGWIRVGPDLALYRDLMNNWRGEAPTPEEEQDYRAAWRRDKLAPLEKHLPHDLEAEYHSIVEALGPSSRLEGLPQTEARWVVPKSPISADDIQAMDLPLLLEFLTTWVSQERWQGDDDVPSREGLARALQAEVARDPERIAKADKQWGRVDAVYLSALFRGLEEASRAKRAIPWSGVLSIAEESLKPGVGPLALPEAESLHGRWALSALVSLVDQGLRDEEGRLGQHERGRIWKILEVALGNADPPFDEVPKDYSPTMDPLTQSLNHVRGQALHAVVRYALWIHRAGSREPQRASIGFQRMPEVKRAFERCLDANRERSPAIRAVFGQWFPWLLLLDQQWTINSLTVLFPEDPSLRNLWSAAWEAYIVYCPIYDSSFPPLRPIYEAALRDLRASEAVAANSRALERPAEHLAEHIVMYYARGVLDRNGADSLLHQLFQNASENLRRHALEALGRLLMSSGKDVPIAARDRLMKLWESREAAYPDVAGAERSSSPAELAAFGWWFASGVFPEPWALARLERAVEVAGTVEGERLVAEQLAKLAEAHPISAIRILRGLTTAAGPVWRVYLWRDDAKQVLRAVLNSSTGEAREAAQDLIHELGARGFFEFRTLAE